MNSYKKSVESLALVEQSFDVNSVYYKKFNIWPLIRLALWSHLLQPDIQYKKNSLETNHVAPVFNIDENQLQLLDSKNKADIIFFSRNEEYSDRFDDKYYNPFIDPIINLIKGHFNYIKIELNSKEIFNTLPRYESTFFFNPKSISFKNDKTVSIKNFSGLQEVVNSILNIHIDETIFLEQARYIEARYVYFKKILSILRPKILFLVCYYSSIAMSIVSACRSLKITTVDIQHGKQGKYHGLYTHWTNIPKEGYNLLPDFFWTWGLETANNIKKWYPVECQHHLPIIGGNRWIAEWIEGKNFKIDKKKENFCNFLKNLEKVIIVSLQPLDKPLPIAVIDAMKNSPKKWLWLIRLHPRNKHQKKNFQASFLQKGLKNYEIDFATNCPLYMLLKNCHHHVTAFSSVCYEALTFGVPTTITHPTGKDLYSDYINKGIFSYTEDGDALLAIIRKAYSKKQIKEESIYIETSRKCAENAINTIIYKALQNLKTKSENEVYQKP